MYNNNVIKFLELMYFTCSLFKSIHNSISLYLPNILFTLDSLNDIFESIIKINSIFELMEHKELVDIED